MDKAASKPSRLNIKSLLRPHIKLLMVGLAAVIGEGVADLLQPWPLKIVLDNVLQSRQIHGWLSPLILSTVGGDSPNSSVAEPTLIVPAMSRAAPQHPPSRRSNHMTHRLSSNINPSSTKRSQVTLLAGPRSSMDRARAS